MGRRKILGNQTPSTASEPETRLTTTSEATQAVKSESDIVDSIIADWEMYLTGKKKKPKTIEVYKYNLRRFLQWTREQGTGTPSTDTLIDWDKAMQAKGLSVYTRNLRITVVKEFYGWLSKHKGMDDITADVELNHIERDHTRDYLRLDEMQTLLASVDDTTLVGKRNKAIIAVLLTAGLRTCEISRLDIGDLHKRSGVYFLSVLGKGKNQKVDIRISEKTAEVINRWLAAREEADIVNEQSPLFCSVSNSNFGEQLPPSTVSTLTKKMLQSANLRREGIVPHSLRHSYATNLLRQGAPIDQIRQAMRHEQITTTMIYAHTIEREENKCSDIIADSIF